MRITLTFLFVHLFINLFSQPISEKEIKEIAAEVNEKIKGTTLSDGTVIKGCFAIGRTMFYQYEVTDFWQPSLNFREETISNFKSGGYGDVYYLNKIDIELQYFYQNTLKNKLAINYFEFSNYNFELGEYISIKNHPKSNGVNLKLKAPLGWEIKEGLRPHIVKKFEYNLNSYGITIGENLTFFSRKQAKELFLNQEYLTTFSEEFLSFLTSPKIIDEFPVTIDNYPGYYFKASGEMERSGITMPVNILNWIIYYEDRVIILQGVGIKQKESLELEKTFFKITNSIIFPEQY